jgi:hypothetical protein
MMIKNKDGVKYFMIMIVIFRLIIQDTLMIYIIFY